MSLSNNDNFIETWQCSVETPLVVSLLAIIYVCIGARIWIVHRHMSWRSRHGESTILVIIAGILCAIYIPLYSYMIRWIRDNVDNVRVLETQAVGPVEMSIAARIIFIVILWIDKWAVFVVFLEAWSLVGRRLRWMYVFTAAFLAVTCAAVIGLTVARAVLYVKLTKEGIPEFVTSFEPEVEVPVSSMNMATDILILIIAVWTIRSLSRGTRSATLMFIMIGFTVTIATVRLALILAIWSMTPVTAQTPPATINLVVRLLDAYTPFTTLETFLVTIMATLPGVRALWRHERKKSISSSKGSESSVSVSIV